MIAQAEQKLEKNMEFPLFKHYIFSSNSYYKHREHQRFCTCGCTFAEDSYFYKCPACGTNNRITCDMDKTTNHIMAITYVPEVQDDFRFTITRYDLIATMIPAEKKLTLSTVKKGWMEFDYEKRSCRSWSLKKDKYIENKQVEDVTKHQIRDHLKVHSIDYHELKKEKREDIKSMDDVNVPYLLSYMKVLGLDTEVLRKCDRLFTRTGFEELFLQHLPIGDRYDISLTNFFKFVSYWTKNPKIETLIKTNKFCLAIECLEKNILLESLFNEKKLFKLPKYVIDDESFQDLKSESVKKLELIHEFGKGVHPEFWQHLKEHDLLKYKSLQKMSDLASYGFTTLEMQDYMIRADEYQAIPVASALEYWRDYVNMAREGQLVYEKFPKSLKRCHDLMAREYKYVCDSETAALFLEQTPEWNKYNYTNNVYTILPPTSAAEVINEGNTLNHCVATYVKKVAARETLILFLRKTNDLETPFYTVEILKGKINQVKGYSDRLIKEKELVDFVASFAKNKHLKCDYDM
jgi:hypothetical protein